MSGKDGLAGHFPRFGNAVRVQVAAFTLVQYFHDPGAVVSLQVFHGLARQRFHAIGIVLLTAEAAKHPHPFRDDE